MPAAPGFRPPTPTPKPSGHTSSSSSGHSTSTNDTPGPTPRSSMDTSTEPQFQGHRSSTSFENSGRTRLVNDPPTPPLSTKSSSSSLSGKLPGAKARQASQRRKEEMEADSKRRQEEAEARHKGDKKEADEKKAEVDKQRDQEDQGIKDQYKKDRADLEQQQQADIAKLKADVQTANFEKHGTIKLTGHKAKHLANETKALQQQYKVKFDQLRNKGIADRRSVAEQRKQEKKQIEAGYQAKVKATKDKIAKDEIEAARLANGGYPAPQAKPKEPVYGQKNLDENRQTRADIDEQDVKFQKKMEAKDAEIQKAEQKEQFYQSLSPSLRNNRSVQQDARDNQQKLTALRQETRDMQAQHNKDVQAKHDYVDATPAQKIQKLNTEEKQLASQKADVDTKYQKMIDDKKASQKTEMESHDAKIKTEESNLARQRDLLGEMPNDRTRLETLEKQRTQIQNRHTQELGAVKAKQDAEGASIQAQIDVIQVRRVDLEHDTALPVAPKPEKPVGTTKTPEEQAQSKLIDEKYQKQREEVAALQKQRNEAQQGKNFHERMNLDAKFRHDKAQVEARYGKEIADIRSSTAKPGQKTTSSKDKSTEEQALQEKEGMAHKRTQELNTQKNELQTKIGAKDKEIEAERARVDADRASGKDPDTTKLNSLQEDRKFLEQEQKINGLEYQVAARDHGIAQKDLDIHILKSDKDGNATGFSPSERATKQADLEKDKNTTLTEKAELEKQLKTEKDDFNQKLETKKSNLDNEIREKDTKIQSLKDKEHPTETEKAELNKLTQEKAELEAKKTDIDGKLAVNKQTDETPEAKKSGDFTAEELAVLKQQANPSKMTKLLQSNWLQGAMVLMGVGGAFLMLYQFMQGKQQEEEAAAAGGAGASGGGAGGMMDPSMASMPPDPSAQYSPLSQGMQGGYY